MDNTRDAVAEYRRRRQKRLDQKAVDRFLERRHNRIEARREDEEGAHGNTKIPFGLCEREGIDIGKDWTPRDAWSALEGEGISPDSVYKGMQEKSKKERRAKKIRAALKSKPNKAVFFSNCSQRDENGNVIKESTDYAREFAESNDCVTMEILMRNSGIDMPSFDLNDPDSVAAWTNSSKDYAEQASGDVTVVMSPPLREGNIFENVELPALKANPNVTSVTMINAQTNEKNEIFRR